MKSLFTLLLILTSLNGYASETTTPSAAGFGEATTCTFESQLSIIYGSVKGKCRNGMEIELEGIVGGLRAADVSFMAIACLGVMEGTFGAVSADVGIGPAGFGLGYFSNSLGICTAGFFHAEHVVAANISVSKLVLTRGAVE